MKKSQIALQLYTIRAHTQNAVDFAASMRKVKTLGYQAVQVSGTGPIPPAEIRRITSGEGLTICATHEPGKSIVENPAAVVERLGILGCTHTAYPYPHLPIGTVDEVKVLAQALDAAGEVLRSAGMTLSYHNHAMELRKVEGQTVLERLYASTNPLNLKGEIDTFWIQSGGGDPVRWCEKLAGRLPLLHLKDFGIDADNKPRMAEIGYGNLDFAAIVQAADRAGCEWFIVEQDDGWVDPFESVKMSLDYLSTLASN